MNSEIYIKACELAQAIAQSAEACELKKAEQQIRQDKIANNLAERWKKVYERITELQNSDQTLTEKDEHSIEFIEAKVENHPLILEFIDAHQKFTEMLEEINNILTGALAFDTNENIDSCTNCPSQGKCAIDSNKM
jgi:cell fate (sporulation/competence/biofilm development) regulator YlbF (YheA/YmcA/DUF963 family)